jgi:hypothetical protein
MPYHYAKQGKRAVFNPDAVAFEKAGETVGDEFARKIRMSRIVPDALRKGARVLNRRATAGFRCSISGTAPAVTPVAFASAGVCGEPRPLPCGKLGRSRSFLAADGGARGDAFAAPAAQPEQGAQDGRVLRHDGACPGDWRMAQPDGQAESRLGKGGKYAVKRRVGKE